MARKKIPIEALIDLFQRLEIMPARSPERKILIAKKAELYGLSKASVYRALKKYTKPKRVHRCDYGTPKVLTKAEMEHYCQIIAALKIRTSNKKGRHLSTGESIRLLEEHGIHTPDGLVKAPKSLLKIPTVNRYLKEWGYTESHLLRQPVPVRFQARYSNDCWHFDLSDSDLKELNAPLKIKEGKGNPKLKLYSVVDDRSGVAYQEYHCVYGEDVEAGLKFLFNAMSLKPHKDFLFQGIPKMIYMDNGPITKSNIFKQVMDYLQVNIKAHLPQGKDGRRTTARSKGKVERPFRTVKEMHETLYHLYEPKDEAEANQGLIAFLLRYNSMQHRSEQHSRIEDWLKNFPPDRIREMCSWERFCTFARQPEERKVGADARISIDGSFYEVDPELAGEKVILWWGLFDNQLYVEHNEKRSGPYTLVGEPIPLHQFRMKKKTKSEERADYIFHLAQQLSLSKEALISNHVSVHFSEEAEIPIQKFSDPDPFQEFAFSNVVEAKKSIAKYLGIPLAKLSPLELLKIDEILAKTLNKSMVIEQIRANFSSNKG